MEGGLRRLPVKAKPSWVLVEDQDSLLTFISHCKSAIFLMCDVP